MLLAIASFVVGMFLLYDVHIEYALVAIITACCLTLSSLLIEKEEENMILKQQLSDTYLRGTRPIIRVVV
jgi:Na+/H+ antiporter NhaD/arsenite permease-like protein